MIFLTQYILQIDSEKCVRRRRTCEKMAMPLLVRSVACSNDGVRQVSSDARICMSNSWPGCPVYFEGLQTTHTPIYVSLVVLLIYSSVYTESTIKKEYRPRLKYSFRVNITKIPPQLRQRRDCEQT